VRCYKPWFTESPWASHALPSNRLPFSFSFIIPVPWRAASNLPLGRNGEEEPKWTYHKKTRRNTALGMQCILEGPQDAFPCPNHTSFALLSRSPNDFIRSQHAAVHQVRNSSGYELLPASQSRLSSRDGGQNRRPCAANEASPHPSLMVFHMAPDGRMWLFLASCMACG